MSRVWLIARHHFRQETGKRSFVFVLLSLPLFMALALGMGFLTVSLERSITALGYVDQAGFLVQFLPSPEDPKVHLVRLETPEAARAALEAGDIDAYYVLPAGYLETGQAELVYFEPPPYDAVHHFDDTVRLNLLAGQSPEVADRAMSGPSVTVRATVWQREFPAGGPEAGQFLPLIIAAMFVFLVLTTSGYMMQVIVAEKESRTMEVVISSVSPGKMMAGKIMGALGITLVQLLVWIAFLAGAVWLGGGLLGIEWLQTLRPDWAGLAMILAVALPAYFCIGAGMTLLGSTLIESQEAQQAGALFFLPMFLPLYFILPIAQNPNGPLAVGLSLFPVTSVMTMAIRHIFAQIPAWQIAVSAVIALGMGAVLVWLTGKALRLSMLRYGQRLRLGELLARHSSPETASGARV